MRLASDSRDVQDHFQQIASVLAMNPYPNPQFPLITEDWAPDNRMVYTYSDRFFPYAIQYLIFEPAEDDIDGYISVIDVIPLRRRRPNP